MEAPYLLLQNVITEILPPTDGTLSRTIFQDARQKVVLFGFAAGQELSEHTASVPAIMHFLQGEATITLGADKHEVAAGAWVHMTAQLPHSITAKSPVVMLLTLLKSSGVQG